MKNKVMIVAYHYIRDLAHSRYPEIKGLDLNLFRAQIRFIKENFNVITMEELIASLDGSCSLPSKAALLTFDDGYIDHFTNAFSILKNEGIQGSFFVPGKILKGGVLLDVNKIHFIMASTNEERLFQELVNKMDYYRGKIEDFPSTEELYEEYGKESRYDSARTRFIKRMLQIALPEKVRNQILDELFIQYVDVSEEQLAGELYMTREQIYCMKNSGMFIGLHGYDHALMGAVETEYCMNDMLRARESMEDFIDSSCWIMNYPHGSYNQDVIDFISKHGCKAGFTIKQAVADISTDNPYLLPRLDTNDLPPKSENYKKYF